MSDQFKRVVVALFNSNRTIGKEGHRAESAVKIALANLSDTGYLTEDSLGRPLEEMQETTKGKKVSREKRSDGTHARKMLDFEKIWQLYVERMALVESEAAQDVEK